MGGIHDQPWLRILLLITFFVAVRGFKTSPRTIAIAIIRDKFSGDYMARIMSFVTVVFLLIPVVAPALGKLTLDHYNWQGIFYIQMIIGVLVWIWFWKRQPETLSPKNKSDFTRQVFINGFSEIIKHKITMGYTIILSLIHISEPTRPY